MKLETHWEKLQHLADWANTTERRNVEVSKETLFWALEQLSRWEMVRGLDLDIAEDFDTEPQPLNEEEPL
jgi:hypothetical protein